MTLCVHNWTTATESFVLIASKLQFSDLKNLKIWAPFDPSTPLDVRGLNVIYILMWKKYAFIEIPFTYRRSVANAYTP